MGKKAGRPGASVSFNVGSQNPNAVHSSNGVHKWCRLAGVKRVNPHAFRHSAATHMLENGADIRVIQKLLGHASIMTTEIYTSVAIRQVKSGHANTHPRASHFLFCGLGFHLEPLLRVDAGDSGCGLVEGRCFPRRRGSKMILFNRRFAST